MFRWSSRLSASPSRRRGFYTFSKNTCAFPSPSVPQRQLMQHAACGPWPREPWRRHGSSLFPSPAVPQRRMRQRRGKTAGCQGLPTSLLHAAPQPRRACCPSNASPRIRPVPSMLGEAENQHKPCRRPLFRHPASESKAPMRSLGRSPGRPSR